MYNILGEKEMSEEWKKTRIFLLVLLLFGLISTSFIIGSGAPGTWKEARGSNSYGSSSIECTAKGRHDNTGNYFDYAFHWGWGYVAPWGVCSQLSMRVKSNSYDFVRSIRQDSSGGSWAYSTPVSQATFVYTEVNIVVYLAGYPQPISYSCSAQVTP